MSGGEANGQASDALAYPWRGRRDLAEDAAVLDEASARARVARAIYAPVMRSHRVTVDQMAILEPVLSETIGATCVTVIREGMDEAIRRGVPAEAARDFILGHLNVEIAIVFDELENGTFSDGAKKAIE